MKRFSWHSEPGLAPHWYKIYGWLPNRYLQIVMFGDSIPIYKPNRKGGHRHNYIYNVCHRITFRSKTARHRGSIFSERRRNPRRRVAVSVARSATRA